MRVKNARLKFILATRTSTPITTRSLRDCSDFFHENHWQIFWEGLARRAATRPRLAAHRLLYIVSVRNCHSAQSKPRRSPCQQRAQSAAAADQICAGIFNHE